MTNEPIRLASRCLAVLAMLLAVAPVSFAGDAEEIGNYVLTEAALAKYTQAVKNLGALSQAMKAACGNDDSDNAQSLTDTARKLDAVPGVKAAIQSAGLTTREYLVFSFSIFQNGMAAWSMSQGGKLPPGTSMANVNFYRAHEAAMKALGEKAKASQCDKDDAEDDRDSDSEE